MIPCDPVILLSFINTKLRDEYAGIAELCAALGLDETALREKLAAAGFIYDEARGTFR